MKAILFDMDGVLVMANGVHHRAYVRALRPVGIKRVDYRLIAGMRTAESMRRLLRIAGKKLPEAKVLELIARKQELANKALRRHMPLARGCSSVLKRLRKRFRLALVSSTSRRNVDLFLNASGSRGLFSIVLSGNDVKKAKPSPMGYRTALRRLHLPASEALVVEDAVSGVQAARKLKLRVVALSGTCSSSALKKAGAEKIFHRLADMESYAEHL